MWADRPSLFQLFGTLLPTVLFCMYILAAAPFNPPGFQGIQPMFVLFAFAGCLILATRETAAIPEFAAMVSRTIERAFWICMGLYALTLAGVHIRGDDLVGYRAAALYFLIPLAHFLGRWRAGEKWPMLVCLGILGLMFMSMSRMALVAGTLMVPLAVLVRGDRKALLQTVVVGAVFGGALAAGIMFYQPMYDRFFKEDASLQVGGVAINATGRTVVWERIWNSYLNHPIFGQGAGSTGPFINIEGMDHPHNDYLRILHDYGLVGLALLLAGFTAIGFRMLQGALRTKQAGRIAQPIHVAAICALFGVCCAMISDNPVSYIYVMAPLGVLLGASLGLSQANEAAALQQHHEARFGFRPAAALEHRRHPIGNPSR
jgi:O-antigen ligase